MAADRAQHQGDEPAARHQGSGVDAMGLDKHRTVAGGSYGPSFAKQLTAYGGFLAVVAILVVGLILLARELDQPPDTVATEAPWAQPGVEQVEPRPLDFPRSGRTEVD